jgi:hypothetical protein
MEPKEFFQDVLRHDCGEKTILPNDSPEQRLVGFSCVCGLTWQWKYLVLKQWPDEIQECFRSIEGRCKLAASFNA